MVSDRITLTVDQLNSIKLERRIHGIHSVFNDKLIVVCADGLLRMIEFNGKAIQWLDSYCKE